MEVNYYNASFTYMGRQVREKERNSAKSYNETNLLLETKPDTPDLSHMKLCLACIGCMRVARTVMAAKQPSETQVPPPGMPILALLQEILSVFLSNWDLPRGMQQEQKGLAETQTPPLHGLKATCSGLLALESKLQPGCQQQHRHTHRDRLTASAPSDLQSSGTGKTS